jgi:Mg/Co/Ni transporter MgtE
MSTQIQLSKDEYRDIVSYCELNNMKIDDVVRKSFLEGFRIEKYGLLNSKDRIVEKEIIKEIPVEKVVEIIKEVPVIEYVEIIKEVPIERIVEVIKEIPSEPEKIEVIKYVDKEVIK